MTEMEQVETHRCVACDGELVGPFEPKVTLTMTRALGADPHENSDVRAEALGWICPDCGMLQWYANTETLDRILDATATNELLLGKPDESYERRTHMLRMLRQLRRI